MREEFDKYGLLITAAVAAPSGLVDQVEYFSVSLLFNFEFLVDK